MFFPKKFFYWVYGESDFAFTTINNYYKYKIIVVVPYNTFLLDFYRF